ncbi:MAG: GPR endopeptidase [Bacillota bacterium]|nr:GPR endopeptidase [Bacillota bacterium]
MEEEKRHLNQEILQDALFEHYSVRTDLAMEAVEVVRSQTGREVDGATVQVEEGPHAKITRMSILTAAASRQLGKMPGHYSTIEAPALRERSRDLKKEIAQLLAQELSRFLNRLKPQDTVLVVGLGNWNATPDALGPRVVRHLLVTRHLFAQPALAELRQGLRPVAALSPGVLGITGIETGEIVLGVVQKIRPAMVIAVDALAARETGRLCTTIQLADSGINPGSGLGNRRVGITPETLGVPVLAIGVPTVVHAVTIVSDALDLLQPAQAAPGQQKKALINELLSPHLGTLVVTPKEIDVFIEDVAQTVAGGLNTALHPGIGLEDALAYLQ